MLTPSELKHLETYSLDCLDLVNTALGFCCCCANYEAGSRADEEAKGGQWRGAMIDVIK